MPGTPVLFRVAKILAVASAALMAALTAIGNITDYYTNFHFVQHVLQMDTVFKDSNVHYRQINSPMLYHVFYGIIILLECAMAFCCTKGTLQMALNIKGSGTAFNAAKSWAVAGLILGLLIWFTGFEVIGGEWFAMWQSSSWNGLGAAERIVSFLLAALIFLHMKEDDLPTQP